MLREFSARLQKGQSKGAWTYVVMDDSAAFFGTKGLVTPCAMSSQTPAQPSDSSRVCLSD